MALARPLSGLKAIQLKNAAFLMGLTTTGTKPELENGIRHAASTLPPFHNNNRIVSIDMGIKNLGICVLEAPDSVSSRPAKPNIKDHPLRVVEWKKLNLIPTPSNPTSKPQPQTFTPSTLSRIAVNLTQTLLNSYNPTHILLERQRFRSGGGSAVQEWTLRVNMLESMLWASFETMKKLQKPSKGVIPELHEVSPARVATFWCARPPGLGTKLGEDFFTEGGGGGDVESLNQGGSMKKKVEKKDKIAVVRSWLSDSRERGAANVTLEFAAECKDVAEDFLAGSQPGARRVRANRAPATASLPNNGAQDKLDDLADCMLQGLTWVRWMENRRRMRRILEGVDI